MLVHSNDRDTGIVDSCLLHSFSMVSLPDPKPAEIKRHSGSHGHALSSGGKCGSPNILNTSASLCGSSHCPLPAAAHVICQQQSNSAAVIKAASKQHQQHCFIQLSTESGNAGPNRIGGACADLCCRWRAGSPPSWLINPRRRMTLLMYPLYQPAPCTAPPVYRPTCVEDAVRTELEAFPAAGTAEESHELATARPPHQGCGQVPGGRDGAERRRGGSGHCVSLWINTRSPHRPTHTSTHTSHPLPSPPLPPLPPSPLTCGAP